VALWLWLVSFLPWLERLPLFAASSVLLVLALRFARLRLLRALPRLRWLLLAMLLVYAWATPGQYLWAGMLAPTREGLLLGGEQVLRIITVIASLQVLLQSMSRGELFAGLYALARPLEWFGLSRERLAVRLALTIEMTEVLLQEKMSFRRLLQELQQDTPLSARTVHLQVVIWTQNQKSLLVTLLALIVLSFWLGRHGAWL
jgi:energy-coupling factor transporter transmembrane protein EcfT